MTQNKDSSVPLRSELSFPKNYRNSPQEKHKVQVKQPVLVVTCIDASNGVPNNIGSVSKRSSSSLITNSVTKSSFKDLIPFSCSIKS